MRLRVRSSGSRRTRRCRRLLKFSSRLIAHKRDRACHFNRIQIGVAALRRHRLEPLDGVFNQQIETLLEARRPCSNVAGARRARDAGCMAGAARGRINRFAGLQRLRGAGVCHCDKAHWLHALGDCLFTHRIGACGATGGAANHIRCEQNDQDHRHYERQHDDSNQLARCLDKLTALFQHQTLQCEARKYSGDVEASLRSPR